MSSHTSLSLSLPFSFSFLQITPMKTTTIVAAATVGVIAVATIGYAVYFDSKRQSDPEFKRKLSTFVSHLFSVGGSMTMEW